MNEKSERERKKEKERKEIKCINGEYASERLAAG
jgi:hypothetical protein